MLMLGIFLSVGFGWWGPILALLVGMGAALGILSLTPLVPVTQAWAARRRLWRLAVVALFTVGFRLALVGLV